MDATNNAPTAVPAQVRTADVNETMRALKDRVQRATDMPEALRLLACEVAGEFGLLEQFVSLLLTARERVEPFADFENAHGPEWSLWHSLGLAAEDLQDRRAEITGPLDELGLTRPEHNRP
ncbi:hypothetical protein ABZ851_30685 [Streptomyces sp. NPDC047049]|uniref:hypothetical protein n=1 Tax=Streptomyces sp. NPDC047049 TaxID=3156688 RepID=UPI0033D32DC4